MTSEKITRSARGSWAGRDSLTACHLLTVPLAGRMSLFFPFPARHLLLVTDCFVPLDSSIANVDDAVGVRGDVMLVGHKHDGIAGLVKPGE